MDVTAPWVPGRKARSFAGVLWHKSTPHGTARLRVKSPVARPCAAAAQERSARARVNGPQGLLGSTHEVGVVRISIQATPGHWQSVPQAALPAVSCWPPSVLAARAVRNVFFV